MSLLDHFHPPLSGNRHWEGFHGRWAAALADSLNAVLPPEYFAEFQVRFGARVEVDVAAFTEPVAGDSPSSGQPSQAVLSHAWAPPTPSAVMPAVFPDDVEVQVFSSVTGPALVGAIELVSPGNKDRDDARRAFAIKIAAYLQQGIGVVVVDIVSSRRANLHDELVGLLGYGEDLKFALPTPLYATAYRPIHRQNQNFIELWREALALGQQLPAMPLAVRGLETMRIDLHATYMEARRLGRVS
jgi:hypothetical protein